MTQTNARDAAAPASAATQSPAATQPPAARRTRRRVIGVDIARGLAVLGMFAAHAGPRTFDPQAGGLAAVLDTLANGHASILFAVLAGLSLSLLTGGYAPHSGTALRHDRVRIAVRAVLLLVLGMALTELGAPIMVILSFYAVYFLLALPLLRLRPAVLAIAAGVSAVAGPLLSFALRSGMDQSMAGGVVGFGAFTTLSALGDAALRLLLTGAYPVLTWMPFVLAGMALGRLDLRATAVRLRLLVGGVVVAVLGYGGSWAALHVFGGISALEPTLARLRPLAATIGTEPMDLLTMSMFGTVPTTGGPANLLLALPHSGTPFEIFGSGGCAVAVLALCLLIGDGRGGAVLAPLAATGALALTTYTVQALVLIPTLGGNHALFTQQPWLLFGALTVATLLVCLLWQRLLGRGPLEWVLHRASVGGSRLISG